MFLETFTTLLAVSRTTNLAARFTGVRKFLPAPSPKRFGLVGAIDPDVIARQMDACTSFNDVAWVEFWKAVAFEQVAILDGELKKAGLEGVGPWLENQSTRLSQPDITTFSGRGYKVFTHTPIGSYTDVDELTKGEPTEVCSSIIGVSAALKACSYLFLAAWPGRTLKRTDAYHTLNKLFDLLLDSIAPRLNLVVERYTLKSQGEAITIYGLLPTSLIGAESRGMPAVLVSNGLEGTNVESIMPFLRSAHLDAAALFFMEMPGTYAYKNPMKAGVSEKIYSDAISYIASHQHIDGDRIGMMGLSFGGNWTTRMAICEPRLKAVVVNGAPLRRSLGMSGSYGMPQIMLEALANTTGAKTSLAMASSLQALAPKRDDIRRIKCPVLAVNGETDTLVSTQDTVDLAEMAPVSQLKLYEGDDHCAMSHVGEWTQLSMEWMQKHVVLASD